ncbi:MAG: zinc permease, partial [Actinomycetota bacterium]|nr:zinc permease [Actinomycetota bacterium]MDQ3906278.1 zinc permease [Actinomycetota bacterium]
MLTAVLFGLAASSALVIGALVGARWNPPKQVTGVLLAFASSALISALAFELFEGG